MAKSSTEPRPLFVYGTLQAFPLLAWALTGDASKTNVVKPLARRAKVHGYARYALHNRDYPAVVKHVDASHKVDGYLLLLETRSQRKKLDDFEGETYTITPVLATLQDGTTVDADMYVWNGDAEAVSMEPWEFDNFVKDRLKDWIDLFDGIELVGEDSDAESGQPDPPVQTRRPSSPMH